MSEIIYLFKISGIITVIVVGGLDVISMVVAYTFIMLLFMVGLIFTIPTMYDFYEMAGFDTSYMFDIISLSLAFGVFIMIAKILAPDFQIFFDKRKLMKSDDFKMAGKPCCKRKNLKEKTHTFFECKECKQTYHS